MKKGKSAKREGNAGDGQAQQDVEQDQPALTGNVSMQDDPHTTGAVDDVDASESELPNQVEELAQRYLNQQYRNYYNQHKSNPQVLALAPQQQQDIIQQRFDALFELDFNEIQKTRVEGKFQMMSGNFYVALDENLLRAYISLERIDIKRMYKPHQHEKVKLLVSEQLVKILKQLYVSISLCPEYLSDQVAASLSASSSPASQDQNLHGKKPQPPRLDQELLLKHLAQDLYNEDIFNVDNNACSPNYQIKHRQGKKMSFDAYRAGVLDLLVLAYKYDNSKAKAGLCDPKLTPAAEQQREYMEPLLQEMEIDFMPKSSHQVYHVVSMEWFNQWKRWVGLPVKEA